MTGHTPGSAVVKEVQGQHTILRDCIEQLAAMETSRSSLISHLREALQEQVSHFPPSLICFSCQKPHLDYYYYFSSRNSSWSKSVATFRSLGFNQTEQVISANSLVVAHSLLKKSSKFHSLHLHRLCLLPTHQLSQW